MISRACGNPVVASIVSCDCSVAHSHGGMGWSVVCDFLIILTCFF